MARTVKFPLLIDGVSARSLSTLKAHFDIEVVLAHYFDGSLRRWLKGRRLETELAALEQLSTEDPNLVGKLGAIFGVVIRRKVDVKGIKDRVQLNRVRQYTVDPEIIRLIESNDKEFAAGLAFNQKELEERASTRNVIYLVGSGPFTIPIDPASKKYVGISLDEEEVSVTMTSSTRSSTR